MNYVFSPSDHIHFVGIGGIGMSSLAYLLAQRGYKVSGCDSNLNQKTCEKLQSIHILLYPQQDHSCFEHQIPTHIVYSSAIQHDSYDLVWAREHNIPLLHRSDILAALFTLHKGIAISGTHGKTTTSALIAHILIQGGIDASAVIGGMVHSLGGNAHHGNSKYLVAEADESDRTFEKYHTHFTLITNIEREHVDIYTSDTIMYTAYQTYANNGSPKGCVFLNKDDAGCKNLASSIQRPLCWYSIHDSSADIHICDASWQKDRWSFTVVEKGKKEDDFALPLLGEHMLANAAAAIAVCRACNLSWDKIKSGLASFVTVDKRFSFCGKTTNGATIIDDYAHNPTKIKAFFNSLRFTPLKHKNLIVFQPHRYTRTQAFFDHYVEVFCANCDIHELIITDIYAAFEQPIPGVSSIDLVNAINARCQGLATYVPYAEVKSYLQQHAQDLSTHDALIFLGAGSVNNLIKDFAV